MEVNTRYIFRLESYLEKVIMTICTTISGFFLYCTSNFDHFYYIPLFGLVCWYTLILGVIGIWVADGSKAYPQYEAFDIPSPIERVGAIILPGFFMTFVLIHSIVFCVLMYLEFYHRKIGKLIKFIRPTLQKRLAFASIGIGILAQCFFFMQALVSTVYIHKEKRPPPHYAILLATFAILIMVSLSLNFVNYYIMGQYYKKYVNGERWNKFTISFILKVTWLSVTMLLAVVCCLFYVKEKTDIASIFEWAFHFWYGLLLAFWTYDLYPLTELRALRKSGFDMPLNVPKSPSFIGRLFKTKRALTLESPHLSPLEKRSMGGFATITPTASVMTSNQLRQTSGNESILPHPPVPHLPQSGVVMTLPFDEDYPKAYIV